ncbi:tail fiber domain-containing protein [Oceaniglobus ichthyenteri]|uniref:tail fiber domain-containing protein n=1 Tax=Oceaniglobus ichthyenteri TaxID=2136177 RepID=UPI0013DDA80B|nr:tail fiber domain-containing protein [Oceaniglobus ichthyenteri]
MKYLSHALLVYVMIGATAVTAGGLAPAVMEPAIVIEETASSSGGIVIPLLLLALVVAVASGSSGGGGGAALSDARLKTDIVRVGSTVHGLPLYQFGYRGGSGRFEGVMAQDVARVMPDAIIAMPAGYMAVDYAKLGLKMRRID